MSKYGWIITRDHLEAKDVTILGPRGLSDADEARLRAGEGHAFQMRDDDGELYFSGRLLGDAQSEQGFAPLEDYGTPDSGCTSIEYRVGGRWEVL